MTAKEIHVEFERKMAPKNESAQPTPTTTIADLNDDVLRKTFMYLGDNALCAVADVCSVFKRNAQKEFRLRSESKKRLDYVKERDKCSFAKIHNFGHFIRAIEIDFSTSDQFMSKINQYCGEALEELRFQDSYKITDKTVAYLLPFLPQLTVMAIYKCEWEGESLPKMMSLCSELERIQIEDKIGSPRPLLDGMCVKMPKLK